MAEQHHQTGSSPQPPAGDFEVWKRVNAYLASADRAQFGAECRKDGHHGPFHWTVPNPLTCEHCGQTVSPDDVGLSGSAP